MLGIDGAFPMTGPFAHAGMFPLDGIDLIAPSRKLGARFSGGSVSRADLVALGCNTNIDARSVQTYLLCLVDMKAARQLGIQALVVTSFAGISSFRSISRNSSSLSMPTGRAGPKLIRGRG